MHDFNMLALLEREVSIKVALQICLGLRHGAALLSSSIHQPTRNRTLSASES